MTNWTTLGELALIFLAGVGAGYNQGIREGLRRRIRRDRAYARLNRILYEDAFDKWIVTPGAAAYYAKKTGEL
jgi:hypothetical protein